MAINNTSHNVDEYYIGKGIVTLQPDGETDWYDAGNVPEFEFTPNLEELAHNSSRSGTRTRDKTVIISKGGDLRIVLEEWTAFNMAIILLGDTTVVPAVPPVPPDPGPEAPGIPEMHIIDIFSKSAFRAGVRFQGQNDIGPRWNYEFLAVDFIPSGGLNLLSEEWAGAEINGRLAQKDTGGGVMSFGTARRYANGATVPWPAPPEPEE